MRLARDLGALGRGAVFLSDEEILGIDPIATDATKRRAVIPFTVNVHGEPSEASESLRSMMVAQARAEGFLGQKQASE